MSIKISPRLQAAADCIPVGSYVIDVGTDHGKLPVWLVQNHIAEHVWASDIRSGPLQSAQKLIEHENLSDKISVRLTDGLNGFSEQDCDTVSICGMGGETIVNILSAASWIDRNILLVLVPHTKPHCLRQWLTENGFRILTEQLVKDNGRIYPVLTAKHGMVRRYSDIEYYTGLPDQIRSDPLLSEFIEMLGRKLSAAAPFDERSASLLSALYRLKEDILS